MVPSRAAAASLPLHAPPCRAARAATATATSTGRRRGGRGAAGEERRLGDRSGVFKAEAPTMDPNGIWENMGKSIQSFFDWFIFYLLHVWLSFIRLTHMELQKNSRIGLRNMGSKPRVNLNSLSIMNFMS